MDNMTEHMIKKIYDKVYGNGMPGIDGKIDKIEKMVQSFSKDNADDHNLIIRKIRDTEKRVAAVHMKVNRHVKDSRFGARLKKAGKGANEVVTGVKSFLNNVKETLIIISVIIGLLYGIFHKDIAKSWRALKHIEVTESIGSNK